MGNEKARAMGQGLSLVHGALDLLKNIDRSLIAIVRQGADHGDREALTEGGAAFGFTVGQGGISNNGWNGPNAVDANPGRRGLVFKNTSATQVVTLGLGERQPTPGAGIVLNPGDTWNGLVSGVLWRGSVAPVSSAAGATLSMVEV